MNNEMQLLINETARLRLLVAELMAEREAMMTALIDAKRFAEWIECLGRTGCEIYKHELKASADLAIERIEKVEAFGFASPLPAQQRPEITLPLIKEALVEYFGHKCHDYDADCKCCQAWSQFEALQAQQIPALTCDKCGEKKCESDFYDDRCIICAGTQQLRERISAIILPLLKPKAMLSASQPKGDV